MLHCSYHRLAKRAALICTVGLLAALLLATGCSKERTPTPAAYQKGLQALDRYQYQAAQTAFAQLETDNPDSPYGPYGQAQLLARQLLLFDALDSYLRLVEQNYSFVPAHMAMGRIFGWLNEPEEALAEFRVTANLRKNDPKTHVQVVRYALTLRNAPLAKKALNNAVEAGLENITTEALRARLLILERQVDSARQVVAGVLGPAEGSLPTAVALADYYETIGQTDSAILWGNRAVTQSDHAFNYVVDQFFRAQRLGYEYAARQAAHLLATADTTDLLDTALAAIYNVTFRNAYEATRATVAWRRMQGDRYTPVFYSIHAEWLVGAANQMADDRDWFDSRMQVNKSPASFVEFMKGHLTRAFSAFTEVNRDLTLLRESHGFKSGWRPYKLLEVRLLEVTTGREQADSVILSFTPEQRQRPDWLTGLADIYAEPRFKRQTKAEKLYRQALKNDPLFYPALSHWANMLATQGKWKEAAQLFARYPRATAVYPQAGITEGLCLAHTNKWDSALTLWKARLPMVSGNIQTVDSLMMYCRQRDHLRTAGQIADLITRLQPDNPDAIAVVGRYYLDRQQPDKALAEAETGLKLEPDNIGLNVLKARALVASGNKSKGLALFEQLYRRAQGDMRVLLPYSRLAVRDKKLRGQALNMARRAVYNGAGAIEPILNLAAVYWETERYDLVRGEARKALKMDSTSALAHFWLGRAQAKLKKTSEARTELKKALQLGLFGQEQRLAKKALQRL